MKKEKGIAPWCISTLHVPSIASDVVRGWLAVLGTLLLLASGAVAGADVAAAPLDVKVSHFSVSEVLVTQFAAALSDATGVATGLVCAEQDSMVPLTNGQYPVEYRQRLVSLERSNVSARELLEAFVGKFGEYTWSVVDDTMVNIVPREDIATADSFLNHRVRSLVLEDAKVADVLERLGSVATEEAGYQIKFCGPDRFTREHALVPSLNVSGLSFLDTANATFKSIGNDIRWHIKGTTIACAKVRRDLVVTTDLDVARASLGSGDSDRETVLALYKCALDSAPYAELRCQIVLEMTDVELGKGFAGAEPQYDAAYRQYLALVQGAGAYQHLASEIDSFVGCAVLSNHTAEATAVLEAMIRNGDYRGYAPEWVIRGFVHLHFDPRNLDRNNIEGCIETLKVLRASYPNNEVVQRIVDEEIADKNAALDSMKAAERINVEKEVESVFDASLQTSEDTGN